MSQRWRAATCFAALCAAICLVAADARAGGGDAPSLRPAIAPAAPSQRSEASAVRPAPRRDPRDTADFRASAVRTGIALVATGVFAWGLGRPGGRSGRLRLGLLVALALCAFASYYQFFRLGHLEGFLLTDNFHYYVGSKYFRELGYYGLYACGLAVLEERGVRVPGGPDPRVRALRTMALRPAGEVRARGEACRARFSDARWRAFSRDVGFFVEKWPPHIRNAVWRDHGYHPSPVWTLVGGAVAGAAPTSSPLAAWRSRTACAVSADASPAG